MRAFSERERPAAGKGFDVEVDAVFFAGERIDEPVSFAAERLRQLRLAARTADEDERARRADKFTAAGEFDERTDAAFGAEREPYAVVGEHGGTVGNGT